MIKLMLEQFITLCDKILLILLKKNLMNIEKI